MTSLAGRLAFDEHSSETLNRLKGLGGFRTAGQVVGEAISVALILHHEASLGFSDLIVRNPKNGREKQVHIPSIRRGLASAERQKKAGKK